MQEHKTVDYSDKGKRKLVEEVRTLRSRLSKLEHTRTGPLAGQPTEKEAHRYTGIDTLGNVPWGTHFCVFYHTKQDLIDILVPYFKAGLENNESCMWVTSEPLNTEDAKQALKHAVRNLDAYIKKGQIEIIDYSDWYTKSGAFEADSVLQGWAQKHDQALKRGFDGLRLTGNTVWLERRDWKKFADYEAVVNSVIGKYRMLAVCTYCLEKCGASEILDVEHNHQFALIRWKGDWKILEGSSKNQLEARLAEQTVIAQALERSKKEWINTFNAISDWVALTDLKGRILRTNRTGQNFTGKPLDEIIGQSCCKLVHGSDNHIPGCPLKKMLKSRQRETAELQVPNTDRWLMVTTDPVTDKKGRLIGAVHITRDITDRKKAEDMLRESEQRYRAIFEQAADSIVLIDAETGELVEFNDKAHEILGYSREEFQKLRIPDFEIIESAEEVAKHIEKIVREGADTFETKHRTKDGQTRDILVSSRAISIGGKNFCQGIWRDITERKRAEEELRESEERYREQFEHALDATFVADAETGILVDCNRAALKLVGRAKSELIGQHQRILHPPEEVKEDFSKSFKQHLKEKEGQILEAKIITKEGQIKDVIIMANMVEIGGKKVLRGTFHDITARKRAEEELEAGKKKLETYIESMVDGVAVADPQNRLIQANKALAELLGYDSVNEMLGMDTADLVPKREISRIMEAGKECIKKGTLRNFETIALRKDGWEVPVQINATALKEPSGKLVGNMSVIRDITQRKKAEETLQKQREELQIILDSVPAGIWYKDTENRLVRVNKAAAESIGMKPEDIEGKAVCELFPEEAEKYHKDDLKVIKSGKPKWGIIERMQVPGRENKWVHTDKVPYWDEQGNVAGVIAFVQDITDRKRAEEALQESEEKYRIVTESSLTGVFINQDGRYVFANDRFAEIHAFTSEELLGQECLQLIHPDDREMVADITSKRLAGEDVTQRYEVRRLKKDGQAVWCEMMANRVEYMGKPAIMGNVIDITERRKAEEQARRDRAELERTSRLITVGEMASGLAHEINQPLCAILNYADGCLRMVRTEAPDSGKLEGTIEAIAAQADRAGEIIRRIKSLVTKRQPERSIVNLNDIVREIIEMERAEASQNNITVQTELAEDIPLVLADRIEIEQVVLNLVRNAFDAMSDTAVGERNLTIRTSRLRGDSIELAVYDTGKGVPAEDSEKLFDSFFTTKPDGLGIGLSLSRSIIEVHGGRLWAEPNPDCGATFRFTLPLKGG